MKKIISILLILSLLLPLSGCAGMAANYREIEQLTLIQTMGLDSSGGGVLLSLASAGDAEGNAPRLFSASGSTISEAMDRIYNRSFEGEIFCAHVRQVLIGEKAAEEGIEDYLNYICSSPVIRVDVPLYVVRGAEAQELIMDSGDGEAGTAEILLNLEERLERSGGEPGFATAYVLRSLKRYGSVLVRALEFVDAAEESDEAEGTQDEPPKTAAYAGYAVIRGDRLCKYIDREDAAAADLLMNRAGISYIEVADGSGGTAVLELSGGGAEIEPVWRAPGELRGFDIHIDARFSVLETNSRSDLESAEYADRLTAALEEELLGRANSVLKSSASLKADFLGLAGEAERQAPDYYAQLGQDFTELLPELEFSVTVGAKLMHTNNMKEA